LEHGKQAGQVCHCWLVQQWTPGTHFPLLGKPAVAPSAYDPSHTLIAIDLFPAATLQCPLISGLSLVA
jgi:hypothetical protein